MDKKHPEMSIGNRIDRKTILRQNPNMPCPAEILEKQEILSVGFYKMSEYGKEGTKLTHGLIVVDKDLSVDIINAFELMMRIRFPIFSIIPISDPQFNWDDEASMQANNTSGFNYRFIAGTNKLSNHSLGRAIDINPLNNPYIMASGEIQPKGSIYDINIPGTIAPDSQIVRFFKDRGWIWGGDWKNKDYQHFEKPDNK